MSTAEPRRGDAQPSWIDDDYDSRRADSRSTRTPDEYDSRRADSRSTRTPDEYDSRRADSRSTRTPDEYDSRRADSRSTRTPDEYDSRRADSRSTRTQDKNGTRRTESRSTRTPDEYDSRRADSRSTRTPDRYDSRRTDSRSARTPDRYDSRRTDSRSTRTPDRYDSRRTDSRSARTPDGYDSRRADSRSARTPDGYDSRRADSRSTRTADEYDSRRTDSRSTRTPDGYDSRRTDARSTRTQDEYDSRRTDSRSTRTPDEYDSRRTDSRSARTQDEYGTRRDDTRLAYREDDYRTRGDDTRSAYREDDYRTRGDDTRSAYPEDDYRTRRDDTRSAYREDDYRTRGDDTRSAYPEDDYRTRRDDTRSAYREDDYRTRGDDTRSAYPEDDYRARRDDTRPAPAEDDSHLSRRNTPRITRTDEGEYEPRRTTSRPSRAGVATSAAPASEPAVEGGSSSRSTRGTTASPTPAQPERASRGTGSRRSGEKGRAALTQTPNEIWFRLEENCQEVAVRQGLVEAHERFKLTPHQERAVQDLSGYLDAGKDRCLLIAPTGAGKTEVMFRVGVHSYLTTGRCTVIVVPTRDLSRQHLQYMTDRLVGTGLTVAEMHGGVPPRRRAQDMDNATSGAGAFIVGSAMMLHSRHYRTLLEAAGLVIIDDVNAFDERQDLSHLRNLATPCLFATATPDPVAGFLRSAGAYRAVTEMKTMPFDSPPTTVHRIEAGFGENIYSQVDKALPFLNEHLASKSRVYVISRTRARVPTLTLYLQDRLGLPVAMLHGEMADTKEHSSRQRGGRSVWANGPETRTEMMRRFRDNTPSVLVATNLVGSGLDIPMADLIIITDADHFSEAETEQLIGRVGRRERPSDAVMIVGTVLSREGNSNVRGRSVVKDGRVVLSYGMARGRRRR